MCARRIHLLALGGTIAMTPDPGGGVTPGLTARDLAGALPGLPADITLSASTFRQVPGAHLELSDLVRLAARIEELLAGGCSGLVVTQGTDTLEETAFALDLLVGSARPVVVTGALRAPGQAGADGPANLLAAIRVAASGRAAGCGVLVTLNDEIHAARFVSKRHTGRPSAFGSPTVGPLGWVAEDRVRLPLQPVHRLRIELPADAVPPPVALLTAALGDSVALLGRLAETGYAGAVVAGFGAGHLPAKHVPEIAALARRMPVLLASRTGAGEVFRHTYGFPGSERDLLARGLLCAGALEPAKARVLLCLALAAGWTNDRIDRAVQRLSG